jgi:hypothetical protein
MQDKERILEMVASGIITPEEAVQLLECLENADSLQKDMPAVPKLEFPPMPEDTALPKVLDSPSAPQSAESTAKIPYENALVPTQIAPQSCDYAHEHPASAITSLNVSWINGTVDIRPYKGKAINVTEYSKNPLSEEEKLDMYEQDGTLYINWDKKGELFSLHTITKMIGRIFLSKQLLIEVPEEMAKQMLVIDCNTVSSELLCANFVCENMRMTTTSGKIRLAGISVENLKTRSVSGSVNVNNVSAENFEAGSTSGSVHASHVSSNNFAMDSTSGSVHAGNFFAECARLNSTSGSIHSSGTANRLYMETVSGSIKAEVKMPVSEIRTSTVSGSTKLYLSQNNGFTVQYSSVSSKLKSEYSLSGDVKGKSGTAVFGDGSIIMSMNSVSGSMKINKF